MTTEKQVMQAIITLCSEVISFVECINANDVLDDYRMENDDPVSDLINIFLEAAEECNQRTVDRIVQYAKEWMVDFGA